jgi:ketosteroid isomerase-like protein
MANANVDMVKTFILGRAAAREANDHFRRRFDECVVPRTGAPTAGESRLDGSLEVLDPNAVTRIPDSMPYGGEHVGREGFVRVAKAMNETWQIPDGLEMSFHDLEDDKVVQFVSWTGISRHTGRSVPVRMVTLYTLRDGKIAEIDIYYWDTAKIVEATGRVKTV